MGEVHLARRKKDGKPVALKVARQVTGPTGGELAKRLRREAELLSRVSSPHLPKFYGLKEIDGHWVLGMQLVEGVNLATQVDDLPDTFERQSLVRRTLIGVASALLALHEHGILHRDVKPANCILTRDRQVVLVDFGLAWGPEVTPLTATGGSLGTPEYMSPELIKGENIGPKSDVYQLGLIARDLLLGRRKISAENLVEALTRRCKEEPEELPGPHTWIQEHIARWIRAALEPDPDARLDAKVLLKGVIDLFRYIERTRDPKTGGHASKLPLFLFQVSG